MKTSNEWMQKAGELETEVERLREALNNCMASSMAEVERLRRSAEGWEQTALLAEQNKADREAEVAELKDVLAGERADRERAVAEVERLREIAALHGRDALKYHDEVERLQRELSEAQLRALKAEAEVERLRGREARRSTAISDEYARLRRIEEAARVTVETHSAHGALRVALEEK